LGNDVSEQNNMGTEGKKQTEKLWNELQKWESETIGPAFLGLTQDKEYNAINPDRFKRPTKESN
jgi:hypothetical protein